MVEMMDSTIVRRLDRWDIMASATTNCSIVRVRRSYCNK